MGKIVLFSFSGLLCFVRWQHTSQWAAKAGIKEFVYGATSKHVDDKCPKVKKQSVLVV